MHSIFVVNQKGGTGKTTVSTVIVDHLLATGLGYRIVDADVQPGEKVKSSLSAIFPAAERYEIGVSPSQLRAKPALAVSHWDRLYEVAKAGPLFVDFGANVSESLLHWMKSSEIGPRLNKSGIAIDFVVVMTANPDSVADGLDLTRRIRDLVPAASRRLFAVLNQNAGDFDAYARSAEMGAFETMVDQGDLTLAIVPRCISEIWGDCERQRITAFSASKMPTEELEARLETPELETARGKGDLAEWHQSVVENFISAGLVTE